MCIEQLFIIVAAFLYSLKFCNFIFLCAVFIVQIKNMISTHSNCNAHSGYAHFFNTPLFFATHPKEWVDERGTFILEPATGNIYKNANLQLKI
jgi:hypothetical protein